MSQRIGIFGGTFNPVHIGHINSMQTVLQTLFLDEIRVVLSYQSPHRDFIESPTPEQRWDMLSLGVEEHSRQLIVDDCELKRKGISYTIDTVKEFSRRFASDDLFLIIGLDQFENFDRWKEFEQILENVDLVVTSRSGSFFPRSLEEFPEGIRDLIESLHNKENRVQLKSAQSIHFVQLQDIRTSSTDLRKSLYIGQDVHELLPPGVAGYIRNHHLYESVFKKIDNFEDFTGYCAQLLAEKKAFDIRGYDIRKLDRPGEFTLVASGASGRQTTTLADNIVRQVRSKYGLRPQSVEGLAEGRWVVIDYGSLLIHIFYELTRNEYRLEGLWKDGRELDLSSSISPENSLENHR